MLELSDAERSLLVRIIAGAWSDTLSPAEHRTLITLSGKVAPPPPKRRFRVEGSLIFHGPLNLVLNVQTEDEARRIASNGAYHADDCDLGEAGIVDIQSITDITDGED